MDIVLPVAITRPQTLPHVAEDVIDWPVELLEIEEPMTDPLAPPVEEEISLVTSETAKLPHVEPQVDEPEPESPESILPPVGIAISVDHVRVSENTMAFRLRWSNPPHVAPKRPAVYFQYVHRSVFELITADRENYVKFKAQIIEQFTEQQKTV